MMMMYVEQERRGEGPGGLLMVVWPSYSIVGLGRIG